MTPRVGTWSGRWYLGSGGDVQDGDTSGRGGGVRDGCTSGRDVVVRWCTWCEVREGQERVAPSGETSGDSREDSVPTAGPPTLPG